MLRTLIDICRFAAKPQDLPTSRRFLLVCALAAFFGYHLGNAVLSQSTTMGVTMGLIALTQTLLLGGGLWLLLALYRKRERWQQAATALYGTCAITHLAALPVILWIAGGQQPQDKLSGLWGIAIFRVWFFVLTVYILKETLEVPAGLAMAIAVVLQLVFAIVMIALFGRSLG